MNNGIHYLDKLKFVKSELIKTVGFVDTANINRNNESRNNESYFYGGNKFLN